MKTIMFILLTTVLSLFLVIFILTIKEVVKEILKIQRDDAPFSTKLGQLIGIGLGMFIMQLLLIGVIRFFLWQLG